MATPTFSEIIEMLSESEEGREFLRKRDDFDRADLEGLWLPEGESPAPGLGSRFSDSSYIEETEQPILSGATKTGMRLPTLAEISAESSNERRAGGDPYPEGPWRKIFPNAEIEYSYPGDDDYGQRNGMIEQLLKNRELYR